MKKLILFFCLFFMSCAPAAFNPKPSFIPKFEKTPFYSIDLSTIQKPEKLKPTFINDTFQVVNEDEATMILLTPGEYAKIAALLKLCIAYKDIIKEQEILINSNINIMNSLKEYLALEQAKSETYRQLWIDSENAYQQERYYFKINEALNKGVMYMISIGSFVGLILLL